MKTSKYEVGDKVRVIKDCDKLRRTYVGYVGLMENYMGKLITISRVSNTGRAYRAEETDGCLWWGDDCFENSSNAMYCNSLL